MTASRQDRLFDAVALAACAVALVVALQTVWGLGWPYDGDHYRDVAQAQTARDGHPLSDPFYAGEWIWYNPLLPWIVAGGAALARVPTLMFDVQAGPWLNLIAPIGFYLLCVRLAGRGAAFLALVIFLFVNGRTEPALTTPTYSPWLFVATFAQGLFYLTLLAMTSAAGSPSDRRAIVVGSLAGLTFLAHTGPALVLGAIALFVLPLRSIFVAGVAAAFVASPFLWSIVGHYHLAVLNPVPAGWKWLPISWDGFPQTLRANALLLAMGFAGLFVVRRQIVRVWLAVAAALTVYGLVREVVPAFPPIVPTFHFWRYTMAALILLTGAVLWAACQRAAGRFAAPLVAAACVLAIVWYVPQYRTRFDIVYGRGIAASRDPNHAAVTAFLHTSLPADSVVLGSRGASLQIIGPAGRKVVGVNANWSNIYVDAGPRMADRDRMLEALKSHDNEAFETLANRYRVTHVVGVGLDECQAMAGPKLQLMTRIGELCVFSR